jgi:hypothetical protein
MTRLQSAVQDYEAALVNDALTLLLSPSAYVDEYRK